MNRDEILDFENDIGYKFKDKKYLTIALTHSSYSNETKEDIQDNERQEFLGDAVLSIVVSDYLFSRFDMAEGELTKLRSAIVCEKGLFEFAKRIDIGSRLLLGKGEERMGGRERPSVLSDAFEALIAAIYLDGGIDQARGFILPFVEDFLECSEGGTFKDYKTMLQEIVQQNPEERVRYVLTDQSGPDHDKRFSVEVRLHSNVIGRGVGRSKKNAEQMAAKEALELMGKQ